MVGEVRVCCWHQYVRQQGEMLAIKCHQGGWAALEQAAIQSGSIVADYSSVRCVTGKNVGSRFLAIPLQICGT